MTTSSTRSPSASSTRWRRSSTTRPRAPWTATSRTRRRLCSCRVPRTGIAGRPLPADLAALRSRIEARTAAARPEFDEMAGRPDSRLAGRADPAQELRLNVGLEPTRRCSACGAHGQVRPVFESADSGDFERKDAFSFGAWIKIPKGGLSGSVDRPDGRPARLPGLGPLDREQQGRDPPRQQVAGERAEGGRPHRDSR